MPAESKLEQLEQFLHIDVHARARDTVHKGEPFQLFHMPLPALLAKSRRNASATPGETRPAWARRAPGGGGPKGRGVPSLTARSPFDPTLQLAKRFSGAPECLLDASPTT